jgi:hypothetical protein
MAIATILKSRSLLYIKADDNLTRSNLEANPLTAALAVPLADFMIQRWQPTHLKEMTLEYALSLATARVAYADTVLNELVKRLDGALFMITKSRTAALYLQYFGAQRPFEVAAGILGPQLETMRGWIGPLLASPEPTLKAVGEEIKAAVAAADAAVQAKADAENALLVFRMTGERTQLVDEYNALRKVTYGELGKIKHQHPGLPNDFAETFFRHEGKRLEDKISLDQMEAKIDALNAQQKALEKKRDARIEKQKQDEEAAALEQKQAALEAKRKEKEALEAEIRKMENEIRI